MEDFAVKLITDLAAQYPLVTMILVVLGTARVINKPLFALVKAYVERTTSKDDDIILVQIESSKFYKTLTFILDWTVSVKLPPKTVVIEAPAKSGDEI